MPPRPALTTTGNILEHLGLALMIGGMLALGAFVAPAVFRHFPIAEAGAVMTLIFRRYDLVILMSLGLVLVGEALRLLSEGVSSHWGERLRYALVLLLLLAGAVSLGAIHPQIEAYQKAGVQRGVGPEGMAFDSLHHQSESLYKAQLFLGIGVLLLLAGRPRACNKL